MTAVGIDLGAGAICAVALDGRRVEATYVLGPDELPALVDACAGASAIAIDAPADLSAGVHADDATISAKFRVARCGEIAAGQQVGSWVPWVTPRERASCASWMVTGFAVWDALRAAGHDPMEIYPAGAFRALAGAPVPNKATIAGHRRRRELLAPFVDLPHGAELWGHDGIDALVAAVVASQGRAGACRAGHDEPGCDGSAIWFPSSG